MAMRRPRIKVSANLISSKRKGNAPKSVTTPAEEQPEQPGKATEEKATQLPKDVEEDQAGGHGSTETERKTHNNPLPEDVVRDAVNAKLKGNSSKSVTTPGKAAEENATAKDVEEEQADGNGSNKMERKTHNNSLQEDVVRDGVNAKSGAQPGIVKIVEEEECHEDVLQTQRVRELDVPGKEQVANKTASSFEVTQPAETIIKRSNELDALPTDTYPPESAVALNEIKKHNEALLCSQKRANVKKDTALQQNKCKVEPSLEATQSSVTINKPICIAQPVEATKVPYEALANDEKATHGGALPSFEVFLRDSKSYASIIQPPLKAISKPLVPPTGTDAFKCPPNVAVSYPNNEHNVAESAIEDDIIKKDLQQSANTLPIPPSKSRHRIKATPIFGQRRNSLQSTATGDEATTTNDNATPPTRQRERHSSGSQYHPYSNPVASPQYNSPHKAIPHNVGRIRTESNCSVYSDVSVTKSSRKGDDYNQRTTSRRDFEARFGPGVPDKSKLKMFDLIYYNPNTNPIIENADEAALLKKKRREKDEFLNSVASREITSVPSSSDKTEDPKSHSELPVPQLKLNANGELILDDTTLEIENLAEQKAREALANSKLIHLDATTGMNGFYKRHQRTKEWSSEETVRFYRALQRLGTDFSLMQQLFPNRTRRDLKLKFKKEERCNLSLINKAILSPRAFELDELKHQLEEEDKAKAEAEEKWKDIQATEGKPLKRIRIKSVAARAIAHGNEVYEMENVPKTNISTRAIKKLKAAKEKKTAETPAEAEPENLNAVDPQPAKQKRKYLKRKREELVAHKDATHEKHVVKENIKRDWDGINLMDDQLEFEINELLDVGEVETEDLKCGEPETEERQSEELHTEVLESEELVELDDLAADSDNDSVSSVGSPASTDEHTVCIETPPKDEVDHTNLECVEEMNEQRKEHLQKLFEDLCAGCLAVVTTEDPDEPGQLKNDIYMLNKATGKLCERPLELPSDIRDSILAVWEECT